MKIGKYSLEINLKAVPEYISHWIDHLPNHSIPGWMVYRGLGMLETSTLHDKRHNERYHSNSTEEPFVFRFHKA
jgi:hypothetical protein